MIAPATSKLVVKLDTLREHQKYITSTGERVPGASTIAGMADDKSNVLMRWAVRESQAGRDPFKSRDRAADVGTVAHFLCESHLKGWEPDLSECSAEVIDKASNSYLKFLDWWDKNKFAFIASELQLVNDDPAFGATLDLIATDALGNICLIELKTCNGIYLSHRVQLAGQEYLWNTAKGHMVDGKRADRSLPAANIARRIIFRMGKDEDAGDAQPHEFMDLTREWEVFKACLALYHSKKGLK